MVGVAAASNADYLRQLGAAEVIDYTSQDVAEAARRLQPEGFAAIIDVVSDAETLARLSALVRDGGSVVSALGAAPGEGQSRVRGVNLGGTVTRENLQAIAAAVERGEVKPPEIKKLSLEQAGEGLNDLASGHSRGKWVVVVG